MSDTARRNHETILVTEDERMVRELVATLLAAQGYEVIPAAEGSEALRICREHAGPIDLLLTDIVMPGMSGPELVSQALAVRPSLKILYMSGYTEYAVANQGVLERVQSFIWKPFSNDALAAKVRQVLDGTVTAGNSPPGLVQS
jgi:two-component system cell cycle sensor histidine kinase/response regulator CckA